MSLLNQIITVVAGSAKQIAMAHGGSTITSPTQVFVVNNGAVTVFLGGDPSVDQTNGYGLPAGQQLPHPVPLSGDGQLWAFVPATGTTVGVLSTPF